jgi:hypothetical protein
MTKKWLVGAVFVLLVGFVGGVISHNPRAVAHVLANPAAFHSSYRTGDSEIVYQLLVDAEKENPGILQHVQRQSANIYYLVNAAQASRRYLLRFDDETKTRELCPLTYCKDYTDIIEMLTKNDRETNELFVYLWNHGTGEDPIINELLPDVIATCETFDGEMLYECQKTLGSILTDVAHRGESTEIMRYVALYPVVHGMWVHSFLGQSTEVRETERGIVGDEFISVMQQLYDDERVHDILQNDFGTVTLLLSLPQPVQRAIASNPQTYVDSLAFLDEHQNMQWVIDALYETQSQ